MPIIERSPVEDKRDALSKARRSQLVRFAREMQQNDLTEHMPALLIARELRSRGFARSYPQWARENHMYAKPLGSIGQSYMGHTPLIDPMPSVARIPGADSTSIDATDDLMRQFKAQQDRERKEKDIQLMTINQLRDACKQRGIKMERTDNLQKLRDKLHAEITKTHENAS